MILKRYLKHASIKNKLVTMHFIVTATALTLVFLIMLVYIFFSFRQRMVDDMQVQARIIANSSTAALQFGDTKTATEILASLESSGNTRLAVLYLPDGTPFSSYRSQRQAYIALPAMPAWLGLHTSWRSLQLMQDIKLNHQVIGKFHLEASPERLYYGLLLFSAVTLIAGVLALLIARMLLNPLNRSITKPLYSLTRLMHQVSVEKNYAVRSHLNADDEIGALARGFNDMLAKIQQRDSELGAELAQRELAENRLDYLAHYDHVTQLPNRNFFNQHLQAEIENALRTRTQTCLMFIDLDNFKIVNDTLGHHTGDLLLKEASQRLCGIVKSGGMVCRIGGDEFAVVLSNLHYLEEAEILAEKLINVLSQTFYLENNEIFVGASIGISLCPSHATDMPSLLRKADTAMYHAKGLGKNNYQHYCDEMEGQARRRFNMESSLRRALEAQELIVYYQPQIDIQSSRIIGFEALLRWQHPKMGMISPTEFIPLAEDSGLILPIGDWVLQNACHQAKAWQDAFGGDLTMSVNFSGRQLREAQMIDKIMHILAVTGLPASLLDIELTESSIMDNSEATIARMRSLRENGIQISIDDFGTGYSSMSYLKRFPISTLKIDRSFIQDIPDDSDDVAITQAIIALARSLKMEVIAEGVETPGQLEFLRAHGCHKAQGFLFSRALLAAEAEQLLRQQFQSVSTARL
jgi:diguanylate cyclase (GGDEF)-like protein